MGTESHEPSRKETLRSRFDIDHDEVAQDKTRTSALLSGNGAYAILVHAITVVARRS